MTQHEEKMAMLTDLAVRDNMQQTKFMERQAKALERIADALDALKQCVEPCQVTNPATMEKTIRCRRHTCSNSSR